MKSLGLGEEEEKMRRERESDGWIEWKNGIEGVNRIFKKVDKKKWK